MVFLCPVSGGSFVIMGELGSGTGPAEGIGVAVAILEENCRTQGRGNGLGCLVC